MYFHQKKFFFSSILLVFVLLTTIFAYFASSFLIKNLSERGLILGEKKVSYLPIDHLIRNSTNFKYYSQPKPNNQWQDNPDWLGYTATYSINNIGVNNSYDVKPNPPANSLRIMTIGDSHTFGQFVDTEQSYPEQLMSLLKQKEECLKYSQIEVLNLGFMGDDIQYAVHRFDTYGKQYNPNIVIWWLKVDDFMMIAELVNSFAEKLLQAETSDKESARRVSTAYGIAMSQLIEKHGHDNLMDYQLTFLKSLLDEYQGDVYILMYKDEPSYYVKPIKKIEKNYPRVSLIQLFNSNEISLLEDGHPSAKGYEVVAKKLAEEVSQEYCF